MYSHYALFLQPIGTQESDMTGQLNNSNALFYLFVEGVKHEFANSCNLTNVVYEIFRNTDLGGNEILLTIN